MHLVKLLQTWLIKTELAKEVCALWVLCLVYYLLGKRRLCFLVVLVYLSVCKQHCFKKLLTDCEEMLWASTWGAHPCAGSMLIQYMKCTSMCRQHADPVHEVHIHVQAACWSSTWGAHPCTGSMLIQYMRCTSMYRQHADPVHEVHIYVQAACWSSTWSAHLCTGSMLIQYMKCTSMCRQHADPVCGL